MSEDCSRASTRKLCPKEKATKKPRKRPKHCFSRQKRATKKPRKSHEKVTSKNATSNEKSSDFLEVFKNFERFSEIFERFSEIFLRFSEVLSETLSEADFPLRGSQSCCPYSCCPLNFLQTRHAIQSALPRFIYHHTHKERLPS